MGIPLVGLLATRKVSGALLVGLAANSLNQLDTRPGRTLKAYLAGAVLARRRSGSPSCCAYDLREKSMLGDAGSNALGAMLGLSSVSRPHGAGPPAGDRDACRLTLLGERRSLGGMIERTPGLSQIDAFGRQP